VITPSLEEILQHSGPETHAVLSLEIAADTETAISLYYKLSGDRPNSFLIESIEGGTTLNRYSYVGFDIPEVMKLPEDQDPLIEIERKLAEFRVLQNPTSPRFQGGAVGYINYDCIRHFEPVPMPKELGMNRPEALFLLTQEFAVLDHIKQRVIFIRLMPLDGDRRLDYMEAAVRLHELIDRLNSPPPRPRELAPWNQNRTADAEPNMPKGRFMDAVRAAKQAIEAGEIFQVVLSQRFTVKRKVQPLELYRALRGVNPSPYMFYLKLEDWAVVGASPEVLVRLTGDEVLVRPIAGTRRRGRTRAEDHALEADLLADQKELAEHRMLLDLGRNDVGRVSRVGSVVVEDPLHIERYSHVMHIVSDVKGQLRPGKTAFDVLRCCFPAGTVSGAPKIRAMEIISSLEPDRRGLYAGAFGYFAFGGDMDTCIAIRTLVVEPDAVHIQAGAGVVFDSDPEKEYEECVNKARGAMFAVAEASSDS
jgi:anthranilate synthase component I